MKKIMLTISLLVFTSNSFAWGIAERNALAGFLTGVVVTKVFKPKPRTYYDNQPTRTFSRYENDCSNNPYYGNPGAARAWERGCLERARDHQWILEQEAYNQGRNKTSW